MFTFLSLLQPRALSLEFASKVIHGTDLPTEVLKSRTRRLYDLANSKWYFLTFGAITAGFFIKPLVQRKEESVSQTLSFSLNFSLTFHKNLVFFDEILEINRIISI